MRKCQTDLVVSVLLFILVGFGKLPAITAMLVLLAWFACAWFIDGVVRQALRGPAQWLSFKPGFSWLQRQRVAADIERELERLIKDARLRRN